MRRKKNMEGKNLNKALSKIEIRMRLIASEKENTSPILWHFQCYRKSCRSVGDHFFTSPYFRNSMAMHVGSTFLLIPLQNDPSILIS